MDTYSSNWIRLESKSSLNPFCNKEMIAMVRKHDFKEQDHDKSSSKLSLTATYLEFIICMCFRQYDLKHFGIILYSLYKYITYSCKGIYCMWVLLSAEHLFLSFRLKETCCSLKDAYIKAYFLNNEMLRDTLFAARAQWKPG